jgi:para-nitrobenzyl esterase
VDGKTDSIEGNFALQDQLMAIQWVKRNIANFGGDPDNITLIGQSAGAYSIAILMGSKMVPPNLFKRAVLMSTPFNVLARRKEEMKMLGKGFAHKVGCVKQETNGSDYVDTSCLRKVSVLKLMCAQLKGMNRFGKGTKLADLFLWWPHLDGQWLNENPLNMILSRPQNAVPSIIGTTRDEGGLFTALLDMAIVGQLAGKRRTYGKTYIDGKIDQNFGRDATTMGDMYTFGKDIKTNAEQLVRLATDYFFTCPTIHYATAVSVFKEVYVYDVSQLQHFLSFGLCNKRYVCHASDLPLLWRPFFFPLTKKQQAVSERLINHVVGFANGDINQKSTQPWPVFKSASLTDGAYMDFGDIVQTRVGLRAATCPTWMTQLGHDW